MALDTNLVSYWKLDESSGNAADSVGSNTGTNVGSATYSSGKINNALTLNGSSQALTVGTSLLSAYSAATITGWIKLSGLGVYQRIVSKTDNTTFNQTIRVTNGNKLQGLLNKGTGADATITGSTSLTTGVWYFCALVYDGANINLYLNGSTDATQVAYTGSLKTSSNTVSIGNISSGSEWLNGQIDEVGIWSRALSGAELTELYNGGNGIQYPFSLNINATTLSITATLIAPTLTLENPLSVNAPTLSITATLTAPSLSYVNPVVISPNTLNFTLSMMAPSRIRVGLVNNLEKHLVTANNRTKHTATITNRNKS